MKTRPRNPLPLLAGILAISIAAARAQSFTQDVTINSATTQNPDLTVQSSGGVLFGGTFGTGAIPATGDGNRLMWYPKKAAFRVGNVSGGRWDDANIGEHSVGVGSNAVASGFAAAAIGSSVASGHQSFAAGWGSVASGDFSAALSIGTANGYMSTAANGSFALGSYSFAAGYANASGDYSVALAGGYAIGVASIAIGSCTTALARNSAVFGTFNEVAGDPLQAISTDPIFVIGVGTSDTARKNALTVRRDGVIRLGKRQGDIGMGEFGNPGD